MQLFNRFTLTQQWIAAILLAILPLSAAVMIAAGFLIKQANHQRAMVAEVKRLGALDTAIRSQVTDVERAARQYLLLRNERIFTLFQKNVQSLQEWEAQLQPGEFVHAHRLSRHIGRVLEQLQPGVVNDKVQEQVLTELQAAGQEVRGLSAEIDGKVQGLLEREDVKLARVISHMTFIGVLALPGTVFLVVLSSVAVARPMWRLADAIRQLGHEKWQMPIVIDGPADLRALGANLEWMRTRLLASEKQKKAFLRHITHELKTPLAAIMEAGALLRDEVPGPVNDDQRGVLKILKNNADSLQLLIQQLLNYNAVAHGLLNTRSDVDIRALCVHVKDKLMTTRPSSQCQWLIDGTPERVQSDPQALEMILSNLLSNAHDFAPLEGRVEVTWGVDGAEWWLSVADNGPGLAADETETIFKPFHQGRARRRGPLKGTGLGLSIVQECVLHLGGQIKVVAAVPGCQFCLRFPLPIEDDL